MALLPRAVEAGVAFVPGAAFYSGVPRRNTLRLSFVTVEPRRIEAGIEALGGVLSEAIGTPTLLPSLPPVVHEEDHFVALGALAADRQSRIHARPLVRPCRAGAVDLGDDGGALTSR